MILPLLFLLASLLQQYGSEAESSHVSKFNPPDVKEQNGEFSILFITAIKSVQLDVNANISHSHNETRILTRFKAIL